MGQRHPTTSAFRVGPFRLEKIGQNESQSQEYKRSDDKKQKQKCAVKKAEPPWGSSLAFASHILSIITSVDLISAATVCPFCSRISRTASAVIIEVMCWPPMESVICAIKPMVLISVTRPMS
jgi:hypothetical protein